MAHELTTNGFAVDPVILDLEDTLGDLAGDWRSTRGNPEQQAAIAQAYRAPWKNFSDWVGTRG